MIPRFLDTAKVLSIALLITAIAGVGDADAATLNVPAQHSTIAAALERAGMGDIIEVAPGIYQEHGLVVPSGVTLTGTGGKPQDVIIDGAGLGRIMVLESAASMVTIRNMVFMKGWAHGSSSYDQSGGAILVSNSLVRIENCVFSANNAESHGGGVRLINSSGEIMSCSFYANNAVDGGGGALDVSYNSSPLVEDCDFLANQASWGGAVSCRGGSSPLMENCDLSGNSADGSRGFGGGVFADTQSFPGLVNTVVVENQADFGGGLASWTGGGINLDYCTLAYNKGSVMEGGLLAVNSAPMVTGSIIAFNEGRGVSVTGGVELQISCTDMYGNSIGDWALSLAGLATKDGNLSVDPQFCSLQLGDENRFALAASSPLAQNPDGCGVLGAGPVACAGEKALAEIPAVSAAIERVVAAPNPFNPRTAISFEIAQAQDVKVSVYGVDGRLIRVLADENLPAGSHEMVWMGRDRSGRQVSSGTYFVLVKGRENTERLKITLLK